MEITKKYPICIKHGKYAMSKRTQELMECDKCKDEKQPHPFLGQFCSVCLGLDDDMSDCENCKGTGYEMERDEVQRQIEENGIYEDKDVTIQ